MDPIFSDWPRHLKDIGFAIANRILKEHNNKVIFPHPNEFFNAFKKTLYKDVKVVIIGQDPYYSCRDALAPIANGLAFSVREGEKITPSLRNIFKAIKYDTGLFNTRTDLIRWAGQGVLLLNTALTVEHNKPGSHLKDWKPFMDAVIECLNQHPNQLIFLLWGRHAQKTQKKIHSKHIILTAPHPASIGKSQKKFIQAGHFAAVNSILEKNGKACINWSTT